MTAGLQVEPGKPGVSGKAPAPMSDDLCLLIMAGGAGTRFWPWSTERQPKQFLQFLGERSLLQESYVRARGLCPDERIMVLTHENYRDRVAEQLPQLAAEQILCEPSRRDTAAAVAYGALAVQRRFGNPVTVLLTSDHWIQTFAQFHQAIQEVAWGARQSRCLYTLGIRPTYPATGYGYLQLGESLSPERPLSHRRLVQFREKPARQVAEGYLASGNYLWNSGMFAWQNDVILEQFEKHLPAHLQSLRPAIEGKVDLASAFAQLEKISVDFAILEKAPDVRCVVPEFEWSDLGGWLALEQFLAEDSSGNHHRGQLYHHQAHHNTVVCEDPEETVALLGVSDLIVVRVGKKTLVTTKSRSEEVKQLLAKMPPEGLL